MKASPDWKPNIGCFSKKKIIQIRTLIPTGSHPSLLAKNRLLFKSNRVTFLRPERRSQLEAKNRLFSIIYFFINLNADPNWKPSAGQKSAAFQFQSGHFFESRRQVPTGSQKRGFFFLWYGMPVATASHAGQE
jgi:hypothetical protein